MRSEGSKTKTHNWIISILIGSVGCTVQISFTWLLDKLSTRLQTRVNYDWCHSLLHSITCYILDFVWKTDSYSDTILLCVFNSLLLHIEIIKLLHLLRLLLSNEERRSSCLLFSSTRGIKKYMTNNDNELLLFSTINDNCYIINYLLILSLLFQWNALAVILASSCFP